MMHKCQSMKHWWLTKEDAAKCCNARFRRVYDSVSNALVWESRCLAKPTAVAGKELGTQEVGKTEV